MNALTPVKASEIIEAVVARGDIASLNAQERAKFYVRVCESIGLNPMTRPFEYITLNNKLTLYARKDCTDQLRSLRDISVTELIEGEREGLFIVTAKVRDGKGRTDASKGAVSITGLKGEALANALMKAETKAKRRATLSICGLGFLDESELPEGVARDDEGYSESTNIVAQVETAKPSGNKPLPRRPGAAKPDPDIERAESGRDDGRQETWGTPLEAALSYIDQQPTSGACELLMANEAFSDQYMKPLNPADWQKAMTYLMKHKAALAKAGK